MDIHRQRECATRIVIAIGRGMGAGEPEKRAGAERIELEGAFETLRGLVVVAAVLQRRTDSDVRGGQVGVQFNRTGGVLARQPYPLRVWRRGVLCEKIGRA